MPFGSYETSPQAAVQNAVRLMKEGFMDAIKLEGTACSCGMLCCCGVLCDCAVPSCVADEGGLEDLTLPALCFAL